MHNVKCFNKLNARNMHDSEIDRWVLSRKMLGKTQEEVANEVGVSLRAYVNYEKGHRLPPPDVRQKIQKVLNVRTKRAYNEYDYDDNLDKVEEDYQKMKPLSLITPLSVEYFDFLPDSGLAQLPISLREDVSVLPILDMEMSAGDGIEGSNLTIIGGMTFVARWLRTDVGINPKKGFIAYVRGRSMEKYLFDKDLVLCEWAEQMDGEDIYCVSYEGALLVKHLQIKGKDLMLVSENEIYKPVKVEGDNFKILGRVVRRITK